MEPIFIKNLKNRLKQDLPGDIAQNEMIVRTKFPLKKLGLTKGFFHH